MEQEADRDQRIMTIVAGARKQPQLERGAFVRLACDTDEQLLREVFEMLDGEERMREFLLEPLIHFIRWNRPFAPGDQILERFEIVKEIGEGGMGVVYEAWDTKRQQRIAIKSAKPGFLRLLSPELEQALKVRHPNICLVNEIHTARTDHGEVDFLTMEYLEGETLAARLRSHGKLDRAESLAIARQLCSALAEAHRSGVVHRDLKCSNIILTRGATREIRAVVTDFGLAGQATANPELLAGTPRYMAPELWKGEPGTTASDIYSLGVILYEMVSDHAPFEGDSVHRQMEPLPQSLRQWNRSLPKRWDRTILQCLDPIPTHRPKDAMAVLRSLEPKSPWRAPIAIAAAVLLVIAAFLLVIFLGRPAETQRTNVRLVLLPVETSADVAQLSGGILEDVAERIRRMHGGGRVSVIEPGEAVSEGVRTPEKAAQIFHATHSLGSRLRKEGDVYTAQAELMDLRNHSVVREVSGRYSAMTVQAITNLLSGAVAAGLGLRPPRALESVAGAAATPYARGLYFLRRDRRSFEEALPLLKQAVRLDPKSALPSAAIAEAQLQKFRVTHNRVDLEEAQKAFQTGEALNLDSIPVLLSGGRLNEEFGRYEKALENYQRVLVLEPQSLEALLGMGQVYSATNSPQQAVLAYRKAIDLDPAFYLPYEELGVFYYYRSQYADAAEQFRKAIERAPGVAQPYMNLGAALNDLGRDNDAEQAVRASLKLKETANGYNSLGAILAYERQDEAAVTYYERAVEMAPREKIYIFNLADSYRRLGRRTLATDAYRKGMELALADLKDNPRQGSARAYVAYAAARLSDRKRAQDEVEQALQSSPGETKVIRHAVLTYEALGERERAWKLLAEAPKELLQELNRQPDLAEFSRDPRFQERMNQIGGQLR